MIPIYEVATPMVYIVERHEGGLPEDRQQENVLAFTSRAEADEHARLAQAHADKRDGTPNPHDPKATGWASYEVTETPVSCPAIVSTADQEVP